MFGQGRSFFQNGILVGVAVQLPPQRFGKLIGPGCLAGQTFLPARIADFHTADKHVCPVVDKKTG
jgi:hypothetical protein